MCNYSQKPNPIHLQIYLTLLDTSFEFNLKFEQASLARTIWPKTSSTIYKAMVLWLYF